MVTLLGIPNQGQALFGAGLGGFLNGNPIGNQNQKSPLGGLARNGLSLPNQLKSGLLAPPTSPLLRSINSPLKESNTETEKDEEKKDRLEMSEFAEDAVEKAVENARKTPQVGETNQIIVSEDGRFEASIDLRLKSDGSFDLDLAVNFAQSSMQQLEGTRPAALPENPENLEMESKPAQLSYQSMEAAAQRYTSFEQTLQTRDFEARIFFEESKSVALVAERNHGSEMGGEVLSVAKKVSHEYSLNLSISGKDLDSFNMAAEELAQFDDTGTLGGFLEAAKGVLNADSTNLGSFLEATRSLIDSSREHVSAKLNNFFTNMNENYGGQLEELGFEPDYLQNVGEDVEKDLGAFFNVTNQMLGGSMNEKQIEDGEDIEQQELDVLDQSLEQMKEERKEILQGKPEQEPVGQFEKDSLYTPNKTIEV